MKRLSFCLCLLISLVCMGVLPVSLLQAEENNVSFVIAPPPVGYPLIEKGQETRQVTGDALYLSIDLGEERMMLLGAAAYGNYQKCPADIFMVNAVIGGAFLFGNKYNFTVLRVPLYINSVVRPFSIKRGSGFIFAGAGGDVSVSNMVVTVPQWVPMTTTFIDDDTRLTTYTVNGAVSGGMQLNIHAGDFIISPFGSWSYTGGTYSTTQTSTMSYEYPSTRGYLQRYGSLVFGFDLLYEPWNAALSSQLRSTEHYTMVSVAVKWLLEN